MRFIMVLCLVLGGGCALGFHANPTDQGLRFEAGLYPTEAAGDFGAKLDDAGTRRLYANACDRAREPAACLFALALGANPEVARSAYYYGRRVCWGGNCRPFGDSARGMVPMGATYDVGAVTAAYQSVAASFSTGPDIVRPRLVYLAGLVEEPPAPYRGAVARSGNGVVRSGDVGLTAPRRESFPRPTRAAAPGAPALSSAACLEVLRRYNAAFATFHGALEASNVSEARRQFAVVDRILGEGSAACTRDREMLGAIQRARAELDELGKKFGFRGET